MHKKFIKPLALFISLSLMSSSWAAPTYTYKKHIDKLTTSSTPVDNGGGSTPTTGVLSFGATSLSLPAVALGQTSSTSVSLNNSAAGNTSISSISASSGFTVGHDCNTSLAASASCSITVSAVSQASAKAGVLTVTTSSGQSLTISLNMAAAPLSASDFSLSESSVNFGTVQAGQSPSQQITITAQAAGALSAISATSNSPYVQVSNTCTALAAAGSCNFSVSFTAPASAVNLAGKSVTVSATDPTGAVKTHTISLSGMSQYTEGYVLLSGSALTFNAGSFGGVSSQNISAINQGDTDVHVSAISATGGFSATYVCPTALPATLTPGQTCTIQVSSTGQYTDQNGTLTVAYDNGQTVAASLFRGASLAPADFSISPDPVAFGTIYTNQSSAKAVTITNTSQYGTLTGITSATGGGAVGHVLYNNGSCGTLSPGQSCTVTVTFNPAGSVYTVNGYFTVQATDSQGNFLTHHLNMTGQSDPVPGTVQIGSTNITVPTGSGSGVQSASVALQNQGPGAAVINNIEVSGGFSYSSNCGTLPVTMAFAQTCYVSVIGTSAYTSKSGVLTVTYNDTSSVTASVSQAAAAAPADFSISPDPVAFGTIYTNQSSVKTATITNTSQYGTLTGITSVTGAGSIGHVNYSNGSCGTLGPGQSCTVSVTFDPAGSAYTVNGYFTVQATDSQGTFVSHSLNMTGSSVAIPTSSFAADLSTVAMGPVVYGNSAVAKTITISNSTAQGTLSGITVQKTGSTVMTNNCGTTLNTTDTCTIVFNWTPSSTSDSATGTLTLSGTDLTGATRTLSVPITGSVFQAMSGGTYSTANGYAIHTFNSNGTLTVPTGMTAIVTVVGGGGGGGYDGGGGGGAGQVYYNSSYAISSGTYAVTIGAGGSGGASTGASGSAGGSTTLGALITASGGGAGGAKRVNGGNGANGGGSGHVNGGSVSYSGGTAGSGGYSGGGTNTTAVGGAGGGGAASVGGSVTVAGVSGIGGDGRVLNIATSAYTKTLGCGGGGGTYGGNTSPYSVPGGAGGSSGACGGQGGSYTYAPSAGSANTGGGGGGGGNSGRGFGAGAAGGSGVVIVSYQLPS